MAKRLEFVIAADASEYEKTLEWLGKKSERFEKKLNEKLARQRSVVNRADADRDAKEENAEKLANYKRQLKNIQKMEQSQKEFGLSKSKKQDENKAHAESQIAELERQSKLFLDYDKEAEKLQDLQRQWEELQASKRAYYGEDVKEEATENVAKNTEATTESLKQEAETAKETAKELSRYEQLKKSMEDARDKTAEFYKSGWSDYFKGEQDEQMFNNVRGDAEARLANVRQQIASIRAEIAYMNGQNPLTNQFIEAQDKAEELREKIYEIQVAMAENDKILQNPDALPGERLNATVSNLELNETLQTTMGELQEVEERIGQINEAYGDGIEPLKEQIELLKEAKAEAEQLEGALGEEHVDARDSNAEAGANFSGRIDALMDNVRQTFRTFGGELAQIGRGALNVFGTMAQGAAKAAVQIGGALFQSLRRVGSVALNAARGGLQALWNGLQKIASTAANAARSIGGALLNGLRAIGSAALNAGKSLLGFNKRHRDLGSGLKHGFMTVLKYAFGIRSLYFLFRRLRTALTDSIKTFAQHDATTMGSLNRLSAALNTLKASFGAAFAPILNAVAPLLEHLINLCTRAANAIGALFAALTGGKTFKIATAGANNLAKATGGVGKEAKEAKEQLAGFDELEILKENDNNSGSGGSGGGVSYEDMPIPDWAAKIKEMIDNGQWEDLADMLTDKLNEVVKNTDWEGIGRNIGYWLNGAFAFAARALTGFDWYALASGIATMLNNVMYEVDWENLGKILVGKLYIMLRSVAGILKTFDWRYFARSLYDVLRGAVLGIDWVTVGADVINGLSNMFDGIANGLDDINFGDFARELTTRLQRAAEEIDWAMLGGSISHFLHSAITSATTFLQNYDASALGNNIRLFFSGVFGQIEWEALAEDLLGLLSTVIDWVSSFLPTLGFGEMAQSLSTLLSNLFSLVQWGELASSLSNALHTVLQSAFLFLKNLDVASIVESIGTFITNVFDGLDVVTLANDFLAVLNQLVVKATELMKSVNWSEVGTNISDFLYNVITGIDVGTLASNWFDMLTSIIDGASEMLSGFDGAKLGEALETLYYSVVNKIDFKELARAISEFITNFVNAGTDMLRSVDWQAIGDSLYEIFMNIVTGVDWATLAESIFTFLGEGIGAAVEVVFTFIEDAVTALFNHLRSFVSDKNNDGKVTGGEIIAGVLEGIWETIKDIGGWILDHIWTPFINGLKSAFGIHSPAETMKEPGQMIGEGLLEGIGGVFKAIGEWIKEHIFDPIIKGAKDGIQAIKDTFSGIGETVGNAINSGKEAVQNTWDGFLNLFKDKKPDVYPTEEARDFKTASDELNETLGNGKSLTADAKSAYEQLSSTISSLKGKSNLTRAEMELLLQSERMLADLTAEYGDELERQGSVVDSNAQSVQNAAYAVSEEANAVTTASRETQGLNEAVNDSSKVYSNASDSATRYGSNMETASSKSETSAGRVEASAQAIEESMVKATDNVADAVLTKWDQIETGTIGFSTTMQDAISGVANAISSFAVDLASVLQQCVSSVVQAVSEMAAAWNTDWGTPHFHMPIFSMSGVFDLQTGQAPQVIISGWQWMAKGGIIDGATLIGAGEDGKEAIVPLERNTEWIDMVAEGLVNKLTTSRVVNELANAFSSIPTPTVAMGGIAPPNAFYGGYNDNNSPIMAELRELRSAIEMLANQPIQVSSAIQMDRREVGRAVTEFQRSEARAKG